MPRGTFGYFIPLTRGHPDNELPGGGHIDNGLPGGGGEIDNGLPVPPAHPWLPGHRPERPDNALPGHGRPDNSLPIAPVRPAHPIELPPILPDNSLPWGPGHPGNALPGAPVDPGFGGGIKPPVDPGYGSGRPPRPDDGLPLPPGHPDNSLPPGIGNGNFPIFIPPSTDGPTLPIYLPTYLPPGSALVIPINPANGAQPKDVPEGMTQAVIWYGPGTQPTVAYVSKPATPTPK